MTFESVAITNYSFNIISKVLADTFTLIAPKIISP